MKIYFSAKWQLKEVVKIMHDYFTERGYEITSRWVERAFSRNYEKFKDSERFSKEEVEGILNSDIMVHLSDLNGKGKYIDLGIALAGKKLQRKPSGIYVIGENVNESQFYFHPFIQRIKTHELFSKDNFKPVIKNVLRTSKLLEERLV